MRTFISSLAILAFVTMASFSYKKGIIVTSYAFAANSYIPEKYTCLGQAASPPLNFSNIPSGTKSLAIVVEDPEYALNLPRHYAAPAPVKKGSGKKKKAPARVLEHMDTCYVNWLAWNIDPGNFVPENFKGDCEGMNTAQQRGYAGICAGSGTHHIHFKVYALDIKLNLSHNACKADLEKIMQGHILGWGELVALSNKDYRQPQ